VGWLDSLARLKKFYTGQLRQLRQPLRAPYGSLDCLIARCRYKPTGQRNSRISGCQAAVWLKYVALLHRKPVQRSSKNPALKG